MGVVDDLVLVAIVGIGLVAYYERDEIKKFLDDPIKYIFGEIKKATTAAEDAAADTVRHGLDQAGSIWQDYTPVGWAYKEIKGAYGTQHDNWAGSGGQQSAWDVYSNPWQSAWNTVSGWFK